VPAQNANGLATRDKEHVPALQESDHAKQRVGTEHLDQRRAVPQLSQPPFTLRRSEHTLLLAHRRQPLSLLARWQLAINDEKLVPKCGGRAAVHPAAPHHNEARGVLVHVEVLERSHRRCHAACVGAAVKSVLTQRCEQRASA